MLAPLVDGVLLVVRRGHARRGSVRSAAEQLADLGARVLGVVVNHAQRAKRRSAYGHDRRAVQARSAPRAQASSVAAYVAPQLKVPAKSDGTRRTTALTKPGPDGSSGK
jgi:hypothetical protein